MAPKDVFAMKISEFPESLRPILEEIDNEGDGMLEIDEITEIFQMFAAQKRAAKDGEIALCTLPKELRPTLAVFDVDGDGTVSGTELAIAAKLYHESKKQNKRLMKAVALLLFVLLGLVGAIVGLTATVIEASKETKTDASGITRVAGSDVPASSGSIIVQNSLHDSYALDYTALDATKSLYLQNADGTAEYSYTITGWTKDTNAKNVVFYSARGDTIAVDELGDIIVKDSSDSELLAIPKNGRKLTGFFSALMTSGSFMMMQAGAF